MISPAAERLALECIGGYQGYVAEIKRMEAEAEDRAMPHQSTPVVFRKRSGAVSYDRTISGTASASAKYRGLCRRVEAVEVCLRLPGRNEFIQHFVAGVPMPEIMATLNLSRRKAQAMRRTLLRYLAELLVGDVAHR